MKVGLPGGGGAGCFVCWAFAFGVLVLGCLGVDVAAEVVVVAVVVTSGGGSVSRGVCP